MQARAQRHFRFNRTTKSVDPYRGDAMFPFSEFLMEYVNSGALPKLDVSHLSPPNELMQAYNFGRFVGVLGDEGSLQELVKNPLLPEVDENQEATPEVMEERKAFIRQNAALYAGYSRHFDRAEVWRSISLADLDLDLGYTDIVPSGYHLNQLKFSAPRPLIESATVDRHENHYGDHTHPATEMEAAEFTAGVTREEKLVWSGCDQRRILKEGLQCCHDVPKFRYEDDDATHRRQHSKNKANQQILCPRNDAVFTTIHNLDLHRRGPIRKGDHSDAYIIYYAVTMTKAEHADKVAHNLSKDRLKDPMATEDAAMLCIPNFEVGVMGIHSDVEQSMDYKLRQAIYRKDLPFKQATRRHNEDVNRIAFDGGTGLKGPSFPNRTQLYIMAHYRVMQIRQLR